MIMAAGPPPTTRSSVRRVTGLASQSTFDRFLRCKSPNRLSVLSFSHVFWDCFVRRCCDCQTWAFTAFQWDAMLC